MTHSVETDRPFPRQTPAWLFLPAHSFDIVATLSDALGPAWLVQRETDCEAEMSILAMASGDDDNALPTFVLYERDGLVHVATVQNEVWRPMHGFISPQEAVTAIVAEIASLSISLPAAI